MPATACRFAAVISTFPVGPDGQRPCTTSRSGRSSKTTSQRRSVRRSQRSNRVAMDAAEPGGLAPVSLLAAST